MREILVSAITYTTNGYDTMLRLFLHAFVLAEGLTVLYCIIIYTGTCLLAFLPENGT